VTEAVVLDKATLNASEMLCGCNTARKRKSRIKIIDVYLPGWFFFWSNLVGDGVGDGVVSREANRRIEFRSCVEKADLSELEAMWNTVTLQGES
jgi:hypothetical protein